MTTATQTIVTIPAKPLRRATNSLFRKLTSTTVAALRVENGSLYLECRENKNYVSRWICAVDTQDAICMTCNATEFRNFIESATPTLSDPAADTIFVNLSISAGGMVFQAESSPSFAPCVTSGNPDSEPYFRVSAKAFKEAISAIEVARGELQGAQGRKHQMLESFYVYCEGNQVTLLATDRIRIAKRVLEVNSLCEQPDSTHRRFTIDARLVENFARSIQPNGEVECRLVCGGDAVILSSEEAMTRINAYDPEVELGVFFTANATSVVLIDTAQFKRAIKNAAPRVSRNGDVTFDMQDGRVRCLATTKSEPAELHDCGVSGHGSALFRVDLQYLLNGLRCIDCDRVALFLEKDASRRPIRFNPASSQDDGELIPGASSSSYVLMPIRLPR